MKKILLVLTLLAVCFTSRAQLDPSYRSVSLDSLKERALNKGIHMIGAVKLHDTIFFPDNTFMVSAPDTSSLGQYNGLQNGIIYSNANINKTDSVNFYYDDVNKRVFFGQTPTSITPVSQNAIGNGFRLLRNAGNPTLQGVRFNGTLTVPTTLLNNEALLILSGAGHNGVAFTGTQASMSFFAQSTWSATNKGTGIRFNTTRLNDTISVNNITFYADSALFPAIRPTGIIDVNADAGRVNQVLSRATTGIDWTTSDTTYSSAAGTLTIPANARTISITGTGTTSTWTLPVIAGGTGINYLLVNAGSGNITLNTNGGANVLWQTGVLSNTVTLSPSEVCGLLNNGTYFIRKF